jgi:hypothetical protein
VLRCHSESCTHDSPDLQFAYLSQLAVVSENISLHKHPSFCYSYANYVLRDIHDVPRLVAASQAPSSRIVDVEFCF